MMQSKWAVCASAVVALLGAMHLPAALAQGKIVCWKDAAGKVVGCGDKVPAEFLGSGTRELDKQGNVRKTGESTQEMAKRQAQEKEMAEAKAVENRRLMEQKRQDDALLNTFTNVKEIDLKRDRELQALNNFLTQQTAALKGANERLAEVKKRAETFDKDKKSVPPVIKEDLSRAEREKSRVEREIATNEKAKTDTVAKYAEYRRRFMELKGIAPAADEPAKAAAAPPAPAPAPAPAKK